MKQYVEVPILWVILLLSPIVVQSQTLNPSYLSEMPPPARVVAEIKGKDPADAGARQMGAFMTLIKMISDMAYGVEHRSERQLTPDEQRTSLGYQQAYTAVWHKVKDSYGKQYAGDYDHDRDLLVEVLDKLFSPSFRTQYLRVNGFATGWYNKVHANGATGVPGGSSNPNTGSVSKPDARLARGTDPSIPKARAANVDTTIFGLALGEPLRLPICPSMFNVPQTCFYEEQNPLINEIGTALGGGSAGESNEDWRLVFVHNGPKASVLLYSGLLAAVKFETRGIDEEPQWSKELREKYGPPNISEPFTYTPRIGNTLNANDLEWRLPGLHVEYIAVLKKANSATVLSIDGGSIYVETESAYQRRIAKEKAQEKRTKM